MVIDLIDLNQLVSVKTVSKKKSAKKVLLNDLLHFNYLFWSVLPVGSDPSGRFKFYSIIVFKSNMVVNNNRIHVGELLLYYLCNQNDTKITDKFRMSSVIIYLIKINNWMLIDIFNGFNKTILRQAATAAQASNLIATKLRAYDFFLVKSSSTIEKEDSLNKSLTLNLSFYYETASNKYVYCIAWFFIKFLIFHSMQINLNSISQTCILNTAPVPTYNYPLWIILVQLFYLG